MASNKVMFIYKRGSRKYFDLSKRILSRDINPLTTELNPSAQRCLTRFLTGDFAS
jgi:hypothetical protein